MPALLADYAEAAVLITGATGVVKGRAAIGDLLAMFVSAIIPAASTTFSLDLTLAEGSLGYIVWKAESAAHRIVFRRNTFVVTFSVGGVPAYEPNNLACCHAESFCGHGDVRSPSMTAWIHFI